MLIFTFNHQMSPLVHALPWACLNRLQCGLSESNITVKSVIGGALVCHKFTWWNESLWPHNIVKHGIGWDSDCLSVRLSVCHTYESQMAIVTVTQAALCMALCAEMRHWTVYQMLKISSESLEFHIETSWVLKVLVSSWGSKYRWDNSKQLNFNLQSLKNAC